MHRAELEGAHSGAARLQMVFSMIMFRCVDGLKSQVLTVLGNLPRSHFNNCTQDFCCGLAVDRFI